MDNFLRETEESVREWVMNASPSTRALNNALDAYRTAIETRVLAEAEVKCNLLRKRDGEIRHAAARAEAVKVVEGERLTDDTGMGWVGKDGQP